MKKRRRKKKVKKTFKLILVALFVLFISFFVLGFIIYQNTLPSLELLGEGIIYLEYGDKYQEYGAKSVLFDKDLSKEIIINSSVNETKVGKYIIQYTIKSKNDKNFKFITREVFIVDSEIPMIDLIGDKEVQIFVGDEFTEPGYKAYDNVDKDITSNVKVIGEIDNTKVGVYEIVYEVTDSSSNVVKASRVINVVEKPKQKPVTPPVVEETKNVKPQTGTGSGIPILMYHYFYDESNGETGKDGNYMEIHDFEEQVKYLVDNNYYFPSWDEVRKYVDGEISLPKKSVVITVDDGHTSFFTLAIPILNKYNVKATAFIITSRWAGSNYTKYKNDNINFQSHTHAMHTGGCSGGRGGLFRCIDYEKGIEDLNTSIDILGSRDALAYPFGDITDNTLKITKEVNFKVGVTIKYGRAKKGMDPLQLPRVRMSKGTSIESFKTRVA